MDKDNFAASLIIRIYPRENENNQNPLYANICVYHNKFFLIPWSAKQIAVYDVKKAELSYIEYPAEKNYRGQIFAEHYIREEKLYLIPCAYPFLLCIDMDKEKVLKAVRITKSVDSANAQNQEVYSWGSIYAAYPHIYFTQVTGNGIFEFNMENFVCRKIEAGFMKNGGGIWGDEKNVWIFPLHAEKVFRWDKQNNIFNIYDEFPDNYQAGKEWSFHKIYADDVSIYLLPREANMCLKIEKETGIIETINLSEKKRDYDNFYDRNMPYVNIWREKNKLYFISARTGEVYVVEKKDVVEIKKINLVSDPQYVYCDLKIIYEQENRFENLKNFIEAII